MCIRDRLKQFTTTAAQKDAVGFYSSANLVARVPYSMMNAVSLVMFPLIATLQAQSDKAQIQRYVTATAKISVFLLCFMSSVGAGAAPEVKPSGTSTEPAADTTSSGTAISSRASFERRLLLKIHAAVTVSE